MTDFCPEGCYWECEHERAVPMTYDPTLAADGRYFRSGSSIDDSGYEYAFIQYGEPDGHGVMRWGPRRLAQEAYDGGSEW